MSDRICVLSLISARAKTMVETRDDSTKSAIGVGRWTNFGTILSARPRMNRTDAKGLPSLAACLRHGQAKRVDTDPALYTRATTPQSMATV
jgi:hypothetical protein